MNAKPLALAAATLALAALDAPGAQAQAARAQARLAPEPRVHSLHNLACAANVHCDPGIDPARMRADLRIQSQQEAERRLVDYSREFPDFAWRCAATGQDCPSHLTQRDAQEVLALAPQAFAPLEALRARHARPGDPAQAAPVASVTSVTSAASAANVVPPSVPRDYVLQPDPRVQTQPQPQAQPQPLPPRERPEPAGQGGEIEPLDGLWQFAYGSPRSAGSACSPEVSAMIVRALPAPFTLQSDFQRPFNPARVINLPEIRWQRSGPNHWRAHIGDTAGTPVRADWSLRVLNPGRIEGEVVSGIAPLCLTTVPYTLVRQ